MNHNNYFRYVSSIILWGASFFTRFHFCLASSQMSNPVARQEVPLATLASRGLGSVLRSQQCVSLHNAICIYKQTSPLHSVSSHRRWGKLGQRKRIAKSAHAYAYTTHVLFALHRLYSRSCPLATFHYVACAARAPRSCLLLQRATIGTWTLKTWFLCTYMAHILAKSYLPTSCICETLLLSSKRK